MTTTRGDWLRLFLDAIDKPTTHENGLAVLTWMRSEFGAAAPTPAAFNPLATTYDLAPNTRYNHVGVRNYETAAQGVQACAATLELNEPGYSAILGALAVGDDARRVIHAIHASAWGSKPTDDELDYVRVHELAERALEVGDDAVPEPVHVPPAVPAWPGVLLRDFHEGDGTATWQERMHERGWAITVDDKYGPQSAHVCASFQHEKGLGVDGIVGPITWEAAWLLPVT